MSREDAEEVVSALMAPSSDFIGNFRDWFEFSTYNTADEDEIFSAIFNIKALKMSSLNIHLEIAGSHPYTSSVLG